MYGIILVCGAHSQFQILQARWAQVRHWSTAVEHHLWFSEHLVPHHRATWVITVTAVCALTAAETKIIQQTVEQKIIRWSSTHFLVYAVDLYIHLCHCSLAFSSCLSINTAAAIPVLLLMCTYAHILWNINSWSRNWESNNFYNSRSLIQTAILGCIIFKRQVVQWIFELSHFENVTTTK